MGSRTFALVLAFTACDPYTGDLLAPTAEVTGGGSGPALAADPVAGAPFRVTSDPADQALPQVSGQRVVWQDRRSGNWDIYMHDFQTGEEVPLATGPGHQVLPAIDGDRVVWHELTDEPFGGSIYLADLNLLDLSSGARARIATATLDITQFDGPGGPHYLNQRARISGHLVAWTAHNHATGPGNPKVYVNDLSTGATTRIAPQGASQHWADVSMGRVVWGDSRFHATAPGAALFVYDASAGAETQLTEPRWIEFPQIGGNRIVWQQQGFVHLFDLATSTEARVAGGARPAGFPVIWKDWLVWQQSQLGSVRSDLYLIDLSSGTGTHLVAHPATQAMPDIADGRVVWQDDRDGNWDIYTLALFQTVAIDILPGSSENPVKLNGNGPPQLPVALLTTAEFDATTVDPTSLTLGDEAGSDTPLTQRRNGSWMAEEEDVDRDGDVDLILHFDRAALMANGDLTASTTELCLNGRTRAGVPIRGCDVLRPIP